MTRFLKSVMQVILAGILVYTIYCSTSNPANSGQPDGPTISIVGNFENTEGEPANLADEILNLIENPRFSREIAENARALVKEKFTLKEMTDKTEKVYEEVIK